MDIDKNDIVEFEKLCKSRLRMGCKKYSNLLHKQNVFKELSEELADVSNYATLLYCKIKQIEKASLKKLKKKYI